MGTYSILYEKSGQCGYVQFAIDWSWNVKNQWARSEKNGIGTVWTTFPGLDEEAYQALLKHFGLEEWANEFSPDRILSMSPQKLTAARRKKEAEYGLEKKEIRSDTLGYHALAEAHF